MLFNHKINKIDNDTSLLTGSMETTLEIFDYLFFSDSRFIFLKQSGILNLYMAYTFLNLRYCSLFLKMCVIILG